MELGITNLFTIFPNMEQKPSDILKDFIADKSPQQFAQLLIDAEGEEYAQMVQAQLAMKLILK